MIVSYLVGYVCNMQERYAIEWPQNTVTDMSTPAAVVAEVETVMAAATDANINLI